MDLTARLNMDNNKRFTIGKLSEQTGCNIETIRYFEKVGLLPSPHRTDGGFRLYDDMHVKRLTFIQRLRSLGFRQSDVRCLLQCVDQTGCQGSEVTALIQSYLDATAQKIKDLEQLYAVLKELALQCGEGCNQDCATMMLCFDCDCC